MILLRLTAAVLLALVLSGANATLAQTLKVIGWNVESGDSTVQTLTNRVRDFREVDIWGFSEVQDFGTATSLQMAAAAHGGNFRKIVGTTGGSDRLVIIYNNSRLEAVRNFELEDINIEDRVRAPLVAEFRVRSNGRRFLFMVNHLYRGSADGRHEQSRLLNEWGAAQDLSVIAVGDYNYDWNVNTNVHDEGYDLLTDGKVFRWVRPTTLVRSQCSFNSVLDFVFTAGEAQQWQSSSEIIARNSDCPDDAQKSDHRPVQATFDLSQLQPIDSLAQPSGTQPASAAPTSDAEILRRIEAIEVELRKLRDLIRRRP